MPILDVEIVGDGRFPKGLARLLADAAAVALASPGRTWVRLRSLSVSAYAEDGGTEAGARPVFVTVLRAALPERDSLAAEAAALARAVAEVCGRPVENVHVLYDPPARGRIAFGGELG